MVPVDEEHANLEPNEDQVMLLMAPVGEREGRREGGKEGGKEGGREGGREREREKERERERESRLSG